MNRVTCVLCGFGGEIEEHPPEVVNKNIIQGKVIVHNEGSDQGVCYHCAAEVNHRSACAKEWVLPGNDHSTAYRMGVLVHRLFLLESVPTTALLAVFDDCAQELSALEREMDAWEQREEKKRTERRNAAILWDANHDCREPWTPPPASPPSDLALFGALGALAAAHKWFGVG